MATFNWFLGKKKGPGSNSFHSTTSMGDLAPAHPAASSFAAASNYDPPLHTLHRSSSSFAPLPTNFISEDTTDSELTSKVRLILHTELKQIISENFNEMARHILAPASERHVKNSQHAPGNKEQQLLMIKNLEMQLKESVQKQRKLQEEVELLKPERCEFNSGSFAEGAPSPPMLQDAYNSMQNALLTCAVKLNEEVKALLGIRSKKITFICQLCNCFFIDFETTSFGGTQINPQISTFQRPDKDLKRRLFKEYMDYRTENESSLFAAETLFRSFCSSRFKLLIYNNNDSTPFTGPEQRNSVLVKLLQEETCPLFVDFVRLAKTVWLLHKLSFAFEPTAEIFRVNEGCQYDAEYMEVHDGDTESVKKREGAEVGFMAAPGFTIRNFVIKAQVHFKGKET